MQSKSTRIAYLKRRLRDFAEHEAMWSGPERLLSDITDEEISMGRLLLKKESEKMLAELTVLQDASKE